MSRAGGTGTSIVFAVIELHRIVVTVRAEEEAAKAVDFCSYSVVF